MAHRDKRMAMDASAPACEEKLLEETLISYCLLSIYGE